MGHCRAAPHRVLAGPNRLVKGGNIFPTCRGLLQIRYWTLDRQTRWQTKRHRLM